MPWPIPSPKVIAERLASVAEGLVLAARPTVDAVALSRAMRSARGMFAIVFRAVSLELRSVHDHLAWWGRQYFVDTAEDEFVARHASIWGVEPRAASRAVGSVFIEGMAGTILPQGTELAAGDGVVFRTGAVAVVGAGGSVSVQVEAVSAGIAGNLEAGIRLVSVAANPAIGRITVEAPGMAGGADAATPAELAAATIQRIRQPPHGGAGFDYPVWLGTRFDTCAVSVVTDWIGRGSVGVIVAMRDGDDPRAPTPEELAEMLDYLGAPGSSTGLRPVTAYVVIVPAELTEIGLKVRLRPDTVETRAAVTTAWRRFVATIGDEDDDMNAGPIGATIEPSRISEAISAAAGEYAHDLIEPAARFTLDRDQLPVAGEPEFEGPL